MPKTLTLEILNVRPEDQGTYTVQATNPSGTDETTAKLTVRPLAPAEAQALAQPKPLEVTAPQPTKQDMQQPQAPKVVVPMESVSAPKGSPVLLRATITGKPTPTVRSGFFSQMHVFIRLRVVHLVQRWQATVGLRSFPHSL